MTKSEIPAVRIPLQVFEAFPAILNHTFYFDGAAVVEKSGVDSYQEWVRLRYSGANPFLTSKESSVRRRYFNSSGGRRRSLQSRTERRMDDLEYR